MAGQAQTVDAPGVDRISPRNFERLSRYIYDYSGIKMPPSKLTMLEGRLRRRLRITGIKSFDAYCSYLFDEGGVEAEAVHLIDAVTTNKTDFFREPKHFEFLAEQAMPALVRAGRRTLRCWSAACSTGAEPYTLAMVMDDFVAAQPGLDYTIIATDLSTEVLRVAQRGVYPEDMLEPAPPSLRQRYVLKARDARRREVRIAAALRAKIAFGRMNLMDERYPAPDDLDLIFCRNVLIYFDKPTQAKVVGQLCSHLRPGGYLFLGHSESIAGVSLPLRAVGNTVFMRV